MRSGCGGAVASPISTGSAARPHRRRVAQTAPHGCAPVTGAGRDVPLPPSESHRQVSYSSASQQPAPAPAAEARSVAEQQAQSGPSLRPASSARFQTGWRPAQRHVSASDAFSYPSASSAWAQASLAAASKEETRVASNQWAATHAHEFALPLQEDRDDEVGVEAAGAAVPDAFEEGDDSPTSSLPQRRLPSSRSAPRAPTSPSASNRRPASRSASKTVLGGGLSAVERKQRSEYIDEIAARQGVQEAQAALKRLQQQDDARKKERRAFLKRLKPYLERNARLVELEAEQERLDVEERRGWTAETLAAEGIMMRGLEGHWLRKTNGNNQKDDQHARGKIEAAAARSLSSFARIAVLQRPGKAKLGWTKLQQGDFVELREEQDGKEGRAVTNEDSEQPSSTTIPIIATIRFMSDYEIRLAFREPVPDLDLIACPSWRIDLAYNDTIEQRLQTSIKALAHDVHATRRAEKALSGTYLVNSLLAPSKAPSASTSTSTSFPPPLSQYIRQHCQSRPSPDLSHLTPTQQKAVNLMLEDHVSLVQGPPGTGKTSTIVAAISLLKQHYVVPHGILLTSHTNVAVDNLAQGCKDAGLKVVRAGPTARVREGLMDVTVEGLMAKHPAKGRLDDVDALRIATMKALQVNKRRDAGEESGASQSTGVARADTGHEADIASRWELYDADVLPSQEDDNAYMAALAAEDVGQLQKRLSRLIQRAFLIRRDMEADIFADADVVCCTALSAPLLQAVDFPIVFFDEATMATEPITIATMIKGCQQLSLIGDHKQLSPLIRSRPAQEEGLGGSLFERLMERGDVRSIMLDTQHRMHPDLAAFPGTEFYSGNLRNGSTTGNMAPLHVGFAEKRQNDGVKGSTGAVPNSSLAGQPSDGYLHFVHHEGRERISRGNKSLENMSEAEVVVRTIANLLARNPDLSGSDIGILTPYAGQKELLARALHIDNNSPLRRLLTRELEACGGPPAKARMREVGAIEVETIDGFEGREKRAIVFSLTRSNATGYWGFLNEYKRWNVALTRARNGLWIVGNLAMLEGRGHARDSSKSNDDPQKDGAAAAKSNAGVADTLSRVQGDLSAPPAFVASSDDASEHAGFIGRFAQHLHARGCIVNAKDVFARPAAK